MSDSRGRQLLAKAGRFVLRKPMTDMDLAAFADGDVLHAAFAFTGAAGANGGSGHIEMAWLMASITHAFNVDYFFFNGAPTGVYTANAAMLLDEADYTKLLGVIAVDVKFVAGTARTFSRSAINARMPYALTAADLWCVPVARGAFDFVAATDVVFGLTIQRS